MHELKRGYNNGLREISPISFKHYTKVNDRDKKESMNREGIDDTFIFNTLSRVKVLSKIQEWNSRGEKLSNQNWDEYSSVVYV